MVSKYLPKSGDIIKISFSPQSGHEQGGYRPALVISDTEFNNKAQLIIVCPITNTDNGFPYHIALNSKLKTTRFVMVEHVRSLDFHSRKVKFIENIEGSVMRKVKHLISLTIH